MRWSFVFCATALVYLTCEACPLCAEVVDTRAEIEALLFNQDRSLRDSAIMTNAHRSGGKTWSYTTFSTAGIRSVVDKGEPVAPLLLEILKDEKTEFNAYYRAYLACIEILSIQKSAPDLRWSEPIERLDTRLGWDLQPSQGYDAMAYRRKIAAGLEQHWKQKVEAGAKDQR
jgi:hypothetical protein